MSCTVHRYVPASLRLGTRQSSERKRFLLSDGLKVPRLKHRLFDLPQMGPVTEALRIREMTASERFGSKFAVSFTE